MTFDPTKPVQTRGGAAARIIFTDAKGLQPIVALVACHRDDEEIVYQFNQDGGYYSHEAESTLDLINVPEEEILELPVRRTTSGILFAGRVGAERGPLGHVRITVVGDKVTKTEVLP